MKFGDILEAIFVTIIGSALLLIAGVVYFGVNVWVIKTASETFFGAGLSANYAVLSSALLTTGSMLAAAIEKKIK